MAALPPISSLALEGLLDSDGVIEPERLLHGLNQFLTPTYSALNQQITLEDNCQAEWLESPITVPSSYTPATALDFAHYTTVAAQTIATATFTPVNFGTAVVTSASVSNAASDWSYAAPHAGVYLFTASVSIDLPTTAAAGAAAHQSWEVNTVEEWRGPTFREGGVAGALRLHSAIALKLAAGDDVQYLIRQATDGTANDLSTTHNDNWITVQQLSFTTQPAPLIASCFPLDLALQRIATRPKGVFLAEARDLTVDGATASLGHPHWEMTSKGGKSIVRIKNIPGLTAGHKYALRFLVIGR